MAVCEAGDGTDAATDAVGFGAGAGVVRTMGCPATTALVVWTGTGGKPGSGVAGFSLPLGPDDGGVEAADGRGVDRNGTTAGTPPKEASHR